jgi:hypothetical protein
MKATLIRLGIRGFNPKLKKAAGRLEDLRTHPMRGQIEGSSNIWIMPSGHIFQNRAREQWEYSDGRRAERYLLWAGLIAIGSDLLPWKPELKSCNAEGQIEARLAAQ